MSETLYPDVVTLGGVGTNGSGRPHPSVGAIVITGETDTVVEVYDFDAATGAVAPLPADVTNGHAMSIYPAIMVRVKAGETWAPPFGGKTLVFRKGIFHKVVAGTNVFCGFYGAG